MKKLFFIILSLFVSLPSFTQSKSKSGAIDINNVIVEGGAISGIQSSDNSVKIFRGIPFAAPPVDSLRWKAPAPVKPWSGVRECRVFSASALQNKPVPFMMWTKEFMAPEAPLSEDCLYLNIWTAASSIKEKRPVIVWIHGGAFTGGSGSVPLYDGEEMARKGVVFVTINYRLGVFGFLALPELSKESSMGVSGNYGILDQIAALRWIKNNVRAFGGDPYNITIAGQSAGSMSVCALMMSPLAKGLFQRAIAQSGALFGTDLLPGQNLVTAEKAGESFMKIVNAHSLKELRSMPAADLLKAGGRIGLVMDNHVIQDAYSAYLSNSMNDVPLLTGWNADDGVMFGPAPNAVQFKETALNRYGEMTGDFLKAFPAGNDKEAAASQKLISQLAFGWSNYYWARMQSLVGKSKAYLYFFSHVPPGDPNFGAFHSAEFAYALKTLHLWSRPFTSYDYELSDMMSSYWVNFATSGDPNGPGLPLWPEFNASAKMVMVFGDKVESHVVPSAEQLNFFDRYSDYLRKKK
jgi:para-nitrobenzyl esterase